MTSASKVRESLIEGLKRPVTLADASAGSGVKSRTLQFWTLNGVINCTPETRHGGPGVRRKYAITEVAIAGIIGKFADTAVSVGGLNGIASSLRKSFEDKHVLPVDGSSFSFFEKALIGDNIYITVKKIGLDQWGVAWGFTADFKDFSINEEIDLSPPNSWGAVFVLNVAEIFRNIPSLIEAS